jgi:phosphoesterase RecJ-like protein
MTTKIAEIIKAHQSFEIITHKSPDEDAVGASRAVGLALVALGKSVCLVYPTPVPTILDFTDKPLEQDLLAVEITFLVDVSDMAMLANTKPRGKVVVIDHHRTTNNIGYTSWIDSEKSSTCEMVYDLLCRMNVTITPSIAANLYMGIFGDTGGFMHANTNARVFQIAHDLAAAGADPHRIAYQIKKTKALAFYNILCTVMKRMIIRGGLYASYVSIEDMNRFNARQEDASGIVEEIASIAGSKLIIFLKEQQEGTLSCSIRSKIPDAALKTATAFGGGGHGMAAGFTIKGRPDILIHEIIEEGLKWL